MNVTPAELLQLDVVAFDLRETLVRLQYLVRFRLHKRPRVFVRGKGMNERPLLVLRRIKRLDEHGDAHADTLRGFLVALEA